MRPLYTLVIKIYGAAIRVAALWNPKAKLRIDGQQTLPAPGLPHSRPLWIHCASTGEFEQGRPLIEGIKKARPDTPILLTFFSPSGFEMRKDYPLADAVAYMPLDTPGRMRDFLDTYRPATAVFVKYEIWHNCLGELARRNTPTYLVSAKFRPDQIYFKPYGKWFARSLKGLTRIFTQNEESKTLLNAIGCSRVTVAGDTRFDRVAEIAETNEEVPEMAEFKGDGTLIAAGSTWPKDEELIARWWSKHAGRHPEVKLLIVPHEISAGHISELKKRFPDAVAWSDNPRNVARVLILDHMGLLSRVYRYADIAYIGGGFGAGIHNVLEPAVFGCPVIFGPRHEKFDEAKGLISAGGAFAAGGQEAFDDIVSELVSMSPFREKAGRIAGAFVRENRGASAKILDVLLEDKSEKSGV